MSDGRGTSEVVCFDLDGVKHYTTVVTMPDGEMRYFTNRVRPEYDTEQGRRFGCAWEYVSAAIIPPVQTVSCGTCDELAGEPHMPGCQEDSSARKLPMGARPGQTMTQYGG